MGIRNASIPSLLDVVTEVGADGSAVYIAEILTRSSPMQDDMSWKVGNLVTGDRVQVRTGKPAVGFRRLNEGVARSKATSKPIDEAAALLEASFQCDRELAILGGDPAGYRKNQWPSFIEAMNDQFAETLVYGNSLFDDTQFTGFMPRYNTLANDQVIDAGGIGTDNRSILLVGWAPDKVTGIVPKNTTSGLQHIDATSNLRPHTDGFPIGDEITDGNGLTYLGYKDRWLWRCGLSIQDPRYVVRGCNIDFSALSKDLVSGADLEDLMIQMEERIHTLTGVNAVFYAPREIITMLRRQITYGRKTNASYGEVGGKRVLMFGETPVRRLDAMNIDEARVV